MANALTAAAVKKLRPSSARREIPDGGCPGLHLIIQPSGAKSWALRYRRPDKRPAKLFLGSVYERDDKGSDSDPVIGGHLTLAAAHRLAASLRHQIAQGRDPGAAYMAERKVRRLAASERTKNNFQTAAKDFIEQHASQKTRRWHEQARLLGIRPGDFAIIPKGLSDRWGKRPVSEIDAQDVWNIIDETRRSGAPGLLRRRIGLTEGRARAMLSCLSRMFSWLMEHRRVQHNPCAEIHRPEAPKARDRILSNQEIARFWQATQSERVEFCAALRLMLLTGCRLNEVAGMKNAELTDDSCIWTIPGTRTKNGLTHVVPLAPLAREMLARVRRKTHEEKPVFSTNGRTPISGWSKVKARLDRTTNISSWRLHDLRRTAATGMAEIGIAPHIVEAVLNHVSGAKAGVAGTYNRAVYADEKRVALERWANHVSNLVGLDK